MTKQDFDTYVDNLMKYTEREVTEEEISALSEEEMLARNVDFIKQSMELHQNNFEKTGFQIETYQNPMYYYLAILTK